MRRRRNPEIIAGRINTDGTVAAGDGFTCVRQSPGNYMIRFLGGFRLTAMTTTVASTGYSGPISVTADSANVITWNAAGAGADQNFHFVAVGAQQ